MSNIDKQDRRQVQRFANYGVDMMEWVDGGYVKHSDYLALLDELESAERRNAELAHRLKSAHQFIEHTEAFGYMAASGIIQCGDVKWDVDASKESLRAAGIGVKGE